MLSKDERAAIDARRDTWSKAEAHGMAHYHSYTVLASRIVRTDIPALLTAIAERDAVIARLVGALKEAEGYVPLAVALDVDEEKWECLFCCMSAATAGAIHHTSACLITRIEAALADPRVAALTASAPPTEPTCHPHDPTGHAETCALNASGPESEGNDE